MHTFRILLLTSIVMFFTTYVNANTVNMAPIITYLLSDNTQTIAIDKIKAYADDQTQPAPTVQDYIDARVTGVTEDNLPDINEVVGNLTAEEVDTQAEIQALADSLGLNSAPVANADVDQNVNTTSLVTLNGSLSTDADSDALTYVWSMTSKPNGSSATLSDATVVNPTFTADEDGAYVFSLVVNDSKINSAADTVTINATSNIAYIGARKWADMNQSVQVLGDASLYCNNLVVGIYDDWELPSEYDLKWLAQHDKNKIRNFDGEYWSSTYRNSYWLSVNSMGITNKYVGYAIATLNVICVSPNL